MSAAYVRGRDRWLHICAEDPLIVVDDGGAECLTSFTDEEALQLFIAWLAEERRNETEKYADLSREAAAEDRRKRLTVVRGGTA